MFCPNYKIKDVFDGFNEIVEAFGGKALTEEEFKSSELRNQRTGLDFSAMEIAYRLYHRNGGNMLNKAPNGNDSVLFQTLLDHFNGDRQKAILAKANVYSKQFFNWFGDWTSENKENVSKVVDTNGEPLVVWHHTNDPELSEFRLDFKNYFQKDGGTNKAFFFDEEKTGTLDRKYDLPLYLNIKNLSEYTGTKEDLHKSGTTYRQVVNNSAKQDDIFGGVHMKDFDDNRKEHQSIWITHSPNQVKHVENLGDWKTEDNNIYSSKKNIPFGYATKLNLATATNIFSTEVAQKLSSGINVSSKEILSYLTSNQLLSDDNLKLAEIMSRHDIPVLYGELPNGKLAATITEKSGGSVVIINPDELNNVSVQYLADTILHEVVHALTVNALDNPQNDAESKFARQSKAVYNLFDKHVSEEDRLDVYSGGYIMQNEKEFASIFITDDNARAYIYNKAKQIDKQNGFVKNAIKNFINSITQFLVNKNVFENTAVEQLNKYKQDLLDHLNNKSTVNYGSIKSEDLLDILFLSSIKRAYLGDAIQKALRNAEYEDKLLQLNYNKIASDTFDDMGRALMTRRKIVQRSNMAADEINRQSQLIESQVQMLISPNYVDKYNALRGLAAQLGPQLHADYEYLSTLPQLTADEYMTIAHTNIGTYRELSVTAQKTLQDSVEVGRMMQSLYDGPDVTTPEGQEAYNAFVQNKLLDVKRLIDTFSTIQNLSDKCDIILAKLRTKSVKALLLDIGRVVGDPDIDNYVQKLEKIDFDTSRFAKNLGAADAAQDNAIRALAYLVNEANTKTNKELNETAIKLASAFKGLDRKLLKHLYERDSKGDKTGFLVRSKNYGVFYDEYNAEVVRINREVSKKFNIKLADDNRLAPREKEARMMWNKMRNDWLEKHCDRRYVNRYYRAQEKLSTEAVLRMSAINSQIYQINMLPGVIDSKTGRPDYSKLTPDQWDELQNLITKKKLLRSEIDEFGHLKCDAELEIAKEINDYYEELYPEGSHQMTQDVKTWKEDRQRVFDECGGQEEFDKYNKLEPNNFDYARWSLWNTRNSKLTFIEDSDGKPLVFKQIEQDFGQAKPYYGEEEAEIAKEINKLISRFYGTNMIINDRAITKSMQNHIKNLITKQIKLRKKAMAGNPDLEKLSKKYGAIFNSYIEFVTTERFRKLQSDAMEKATDEGTFDEMMFYDIMSNYGTVIEDWSTAEVLGFRPFRWFTKMQAKDINRWMTWAPGDAYNDVENSKSLKNEYFDESEGTSYIPLVKDHSTGRVVNKQYDNTKEYARVHKTKGYEKLYDKKLAKMYETVLDVTKNNYSNMANRVHVDIHLLPQVTGSLLMRMNSKNVEGNMFTRRYRIFKEWLLEKLGFRTKETMEDLEIGENADNESYDDPISIHRDISDIGLLKVMPDGRSMHIVPQRFLQRKNPKYISDDLLGILMMQTQMAANYKNKVAIKDKCEMIVDMLANRKLQSQEAGSKSTEDIKGEQTNTYQTASKFLEMNLYDIRRDRGKKYNTSTTMTWQASYALDLIRDYTTTNNLGMNPKVSIVGMLTSQWNHLINALTGNMYSFGDANFGGTEVIENIVKNIITNGSYIADDLSQDKQMVINDFYNVQSQLNRKLSDSHLNRLQKAIKRHSIFGFMSGLDFISKSAIADSILHSYRFVDGEWVTEDKLYAMSARIPKSNRDKWLKDKLGKYNSKETRKKHNLYTSISVKNGRFYIQDEAKRNAYNENVHHEVTSRIEKIAERADGMATQTQKAAITQSMIGSFVLIHRQYLPLMIQERFTEEVYDYDMATMKNGQTSAMLSFCKNLMASSMLAGGVMGGVGSYILFQSIPVGGPLLTALGAMAGAVYSAKNKSKAKPIKQVIDEFFKDDSSEFAILKSRYHKKIFKQVLLELALYNIVISPFINWICRCADENKDKWWLQFIALCLRQFQWEAYTPYRFDDIFNNFKTVTAATGTIDLLQSSLGGGADIFMQLIKKALQYTLGLTDETTKEEKRTVKSGVYKNWDKSFRDMYNFVPIHNMYKQGLPAPIWSGLEEYPTIESGGAIGPYRMRKYTENSIMKINE